MSLRPPLQLGELAELPPWVAAEAEAAAEGDAPGLFPGPRTFTMSTGAVVDMQVDTINPHGIPKLIVVDDKGEDVEVYLNRRQRRPVLQQVADIDTGDLLQHNSEKRVFNMTHDPDRYKKKDGVAGICFVDTSAKKKQKVPIKEPRPVWVSETHGESRSPTPRERRGAILRVDAPQLLPRIKRNM